MSRLLWLVGFKHCFFDGFVLGQEIHFVLFPNGGESIVK